MKTISLFFFIFIVAQHCNAAVTRNDRIWPIGGGTSVDLPQSSAYGSKQYTTKGYDFHRGVDIPAPLYSNVYAIAYGTVRIAGSHHAYSSGIVQLKHTDWEEDPEATFYSNYLQIVMNKDGADMITLTEGQTVQKGDLIAYSKGTLSLNHTQFEIRVGGLYSKNACNPWKYMPNDANDYSSFEATLDLLPNYHGIDCEAVVNVSVASDQLTFTRIELHIIDNEQPQEVRFYDMCGANSNHSKAEMDDWEYQDDPSDSSSYIIRISPSTFSGTSTVAKYGFEFVGLPLLSGSAKVMAKIFDVFDNSLNTVYEIYTCVGGTSGPPTASPVVTRNDRIWPIGGRTSVDLPQSSAYGSKQYFTKGYDFHRGVDIPAPLYSNVYAIADGTVRIAGSHYAYSSGIVQLIHTNWEENPEAIFYSNYLQIVMNKDGADTITLTEGQTVQKGDLIAYSEGTSSLNHIQFEIRVGGLYSKNACNPWKYMPNDANDYSSFEATLEILPNYHAIDCEAVVNVSVSPDQLTFTRIELHIIDNNDQPQEVRFYDMCGANSNHSKAEMDDWEYQDDPSDSSSYIIRISPSTFSGTSTVAKYGFEFVGLPLLSGGAKVMAKIFDVFDNSLITVYKTYICGSSTTASPMVTRNDRIWPIGGGTSVDLPQSSAYGSKQYFTNGYDYHRGVDIPAPLYSNVYAIADGTVRIAGSHHAYSSGIVQLIHTNWEENPEATFYSNYLQIVMNKDGADTITLTEGQTVQKGDLIAYSKGTSSLNHTQFEIRVGGLYSKNACNPWKYMPNDANDYSSLEATLEILPNYHGIDCEAVVNVSVASDQLTFTRIELHIIDNNDQPQEVRFYDMCGANSNHSKAEMDDWEYQDDPSDSSSYIIRISPSTFSSTSTVAKYGFEFVDLPLLSGNGKVMAKIFDVFDNSLNTIYETYTCVSGTSGPPSASTVVTRNDRVWPIGNNASVDLPQSSGFAPRQKITEGYRYDFHRGVDIPTPLYSNVHAIADGTVRIAGSHPGFSDGVVQIKHTNWEEDASSFFYSTNIHIVMSKEGGADPIALAVDQEVQKGDVIAYSYMSESSFEHIHFEIRVGSVYSRDACNPWKYLPNDANNYSSFEATLSLTPNYHAIDCEAVVNVSVPPDQLTFTRIELHIIDNNDQPQGVRFYDMCGANSNHSKTEMDDWEYQDDPSDPSSYIIRISPKIFNSQSFGNDESAEYGFEFINLPPLSGSGKVMAKALDIFDNSINTEYKTYQC